MDEDLAPELSGSETDASSEEIKFTLFSAAAREADSRATATFAEMVDHYSASSSSATPAPPPAPTPAPWRQPPPLPPWRQPQTKPRGGARRKDTDGDSSDVDPIAAPFDTPAPSVETADTPAPSVETNSTPAPSVETDSTPATEPSAGPYPCPISKLVPIEWDDVRYFTDESGWVKFDTKISPLPLPHPNMEFRGYVQKPDGNLEVFFSDKTRRGHPAARMPRPSGGVNKQYFDGLKAARTDEERATYRRENGHLYKSRKKRFGPLDPL